MKKIYLVDIWRRIKRTIITYLSIMLIICLGVSSYLGINFAKTSMQKTGDSYLKGQKFHNIQVNYDYGLVDEDLDKIRELDGVTDVEGLYSTTGFLKIDNEDRLVTVQSITENVDIAKVISGNLPKEKNEIAIEKVMADEDNISIGDELDISCLNQSGNNTLLENKFRVTAIVEHPSYSCNYVYGRRGISEKGNGNCLNFFLVSSETFNKEQMGNAYESALVWCEELSEYNCFEDIYKSEANKIKERIEDISEERSNLRYDEVRNNLGYAANDMVKLNWNVQDRHSNTSYAMYEDNAEGLGKLSFSFAFVYIAVAMMVCHSSIGRMIVKQKLLIGTQKALGYRESEIFMQYMVYSWICTFWGCVFGILWAVFFVENIALTSYKPIYYFENYFRISDWKITCIVVIGAFILTSVSTIIACKKIISKPAVELLKDQSVVSNKRRFFEKFTIWKKISLFKRTVFKNLINDKRHMITTIIGIGGCTALMIIGFTLKFAMSDVKDIQFNEIQKFDVSLQVEKGADINSFKNELNKFEKLEYMNLMDKMTAVKVNDEDSIVADLLCFDNKDINDFFTIEDEKTGEKLTLPEDGVLISANTAEYYNVKIGDNIRIKKDNGDDVEVKVQGIAKNYVCHFIAISPKYYEEVTGNEINNNIFFIKLNDENQEDLTDSLKNKEGYIDISGKEMGISIFNNISDSLNSVVEVMIVLSAVMSLVVVLNLISMFINEKAKNLAVMRINGYTIGEAKAFIRYSNVILNFLGLLAGTVLGVILGSQIVQIIKNDAVSYSNKPNIEACLISCGICIVYSIIVGYLGNLKINKLQLNNLNRFD